MTYAEAQRQYQATLEAQRAAYDHANADEVEFMADELLAAEKARNAAWLREVCR